MTRRGGAAPRAPGPRALHPNAWEDGAVGNGTRMSVLSRIAAGVLVARGMLNCHKSTAGGARPSPPARPLPAGGSAAHARQSTAADAPIAPQRRGGPGPDSPLELQPNDWKATLKRTLTEIKDDRVTLAAAGMAYYFFLALFPALIAFVGILVLAKVDTASLVSSIRSTVPGSTARILVDAITNAQSTAVSNNASIVAAIIGIAIALWSASSGMVALQSGLNIAYDVPQDRKLIGKRAVALLLVVATGLLGGVPSPFFTFGDSVVFTILGWGLTAVAVVVLFSLFYYLAPNRARPAWQWVSGGGLVGALIWIGASVAFGVYVNSLGQSNYSKTYGSLAGVIVLVLWLYLSSLAVLVGGELNAELERQGEARSREERDAATAARA